MNWIKIKDCVPHDYLGVRLWLYNETIDTVYDGVIDLEHKNYLFKYMDTQGITHWMPYLPAAPNNI